MPATRFFPDAQLSVVENLLAGGHTTSRRSSASTRPAIGEECRGSELRRDVAALAAALRELGVQPGDRVARGCRTGSRR